MEKSPTRSIKVIVAIAILLAVPGRIEGAPRLAEARTLYIAPDGQDQGFCDSLAGRCQSVQYAVDNANPGDEVRVAAGIYTGASTTLVTVRTDLSLTGGWAPGFGQRDPRSYETILDGERQRQVVLITGRAGAALVSGFTITRGGSGEPNTSPVGGGIAIYGRTQPTFEHNVIISNTGYYGGGAYAGAGTSPDFRANVLADNLALYGGAVYASSGDGLRMERNSVRSNRATTGSGAIHLDHGSGHFVRNVIRENVSDGSPGAIFAGYDAVLDLDGNWIAGNRASSSGVAGIQLISSVTATIRNNLIAHNGVDSQAGGLSLFGTVATIANNTFVRNGSEAEGVGIWSSGSDVIVVNNIVVGHALGVWGTEDAKPVARYNLFWDNDADDLNVQRQTGNIAANPRFANSHDYRLRASSPAANAGDPAGVPPAASYDMEGAPRPVGDRVDIGAYEIGPRVFLPLALSAN